MFWPLKGTFFYGGQFDVFYSLIKGSISTK